MSIARARHIFACTLLVLGSAPAIRAHTEWVNLLPRLHAGQTLCYHVTYHSDKQVQADSPAVSASQPSDAKIEVHALLRIEVLSVQPHGKAFAVHARARFQVLSSDSTSKNPGLELPSPQIQREDPDDKSVEFTLFPDGHVDDVKGLDTLFPEQQQAWQEWLSRFSVGVALPAPRLKIAQKWKSEVPEASPSAIAGLRWTRESTYVRNEPCRTVNMTVQGELVPSDAEPDTCAVILTTATLKQRSAPQSATPEAFKVRELRTAGSAHGKNRVITYISLTTGLLVRATEEANQDMDVTVAKADGSNRVHYNVSAKSNSEVVLVSEIPLTHP